MPNAPILPTAQVSPENLLDATYPAVAGSVSAHVPSLGAAMTALVQSPALSIDDTYSAVAESVAVARRSIARWLVSLAVDESVIGDIALAVSEACTNAVVHGCRGDATGSFRIVAECVGSTVRVTVIDDGCGTTPRSDSPGLGLGLPLMATLAESLEMHAAKGGGTVLEMLFDATGSGTDQPAFAGG